MIKDIYTLDFGDRQDGAYISKNGQEATRISFEDILKLPTVLQAGSVVISEYAHLGVPQENSLSQPYKAADLIKLAKEFEKNNIIFRLFPQSSYPTALAQYQIKYPELNAKKAGNIDPLAIYEYIISRKEPTEDTIKRLAKPRKSFEPKAEVMARLERDEFKTPREESWKHKPIVNFILNNARTRHYDIHKNTKKYLKTDKNVEFIISNLDDIYEELITKSVNYKPIGYDKYITIDMIDKFLGLEFNGKSSTWFSPRFHIKLKTAGSETWNFNMIILYTVVAVFIDEYNDLRFRPLTNELPSFSYAKKYIYGCSPYHLKGGTARSNKQFHQFPAFLKSSTKGVFNFNRQVNNIRIRRGNFTDNEDQCFAYHRQIYDKILKDLHNIIKKKIQKQYSS